MTLMEFAVHPFSHSCNQCGAPLRANATIWVLFLSSIVAGIAAVALAWVPLGLSFDRADRPATEIIVVTIAVAPAAIATSLAWSYGGFNRVAEPPDAP